MAYVLNLVQRALEPLPMRGKGRVAEQILLRAKTEDLMCHPLRGLEVHLRCSQRIERLMWAGAYEREVVAFLKKTVKPTMTVLDVGANIGYLAAIAAELTGPAGQVHAFEPNPACHTRLTLNLRPFVHAQAHQLAISDLDGTLPLYLSGNSQEDGWGSLLTEPGTPPPALDVPVRSLDSATSKLGVRRVDLIKMDIEGNEMRALRGARRLIEQDHPIIIAELNAVCLARDGANPGDIIRFLKDLSYSVRYLDGDNICAAIPGVPI